MQHIIRLNHYFKLPCRGRKPARKNDSYIEYMTKSLLENNRTMIGWKVESAEDKECKAVNGSGFYDKLIEKYLGNYSTFRSTKD